MTDGVCPVGMLERYCMLFERMEWDLMRLNEKPVNSDHFVRLESWNTDHSVQVSVVLCMHADQQEPSTGHQTLYQTYRLVPSRLDIIHQIFVLQNSTHLSSWLDPLGFNFGDQNSPRQMWEADFNGKQSKVAKKSALHKLVYKIWILKCLWPNETKFVFGQNSWMTSCHCMVRADIVATKLNLGNFGRNYFLLIQCTVIQNPLYVYPIFTLFFRLFELSVLKSIPHVGWREFVSPKTGPRASSPLASSHPSN